MTKYFSFSFAFRIRQLCWERDDTLHDFMQSGKIQSAPSTQYYMVHRGDRVLGEGLCGMRWKWGGRRNCVRAFRVSVFFPGCFCRIPLRLLHFRRYRKIFSTVLKLKHKHKPEQKKQLCIKCALSEYFGLLFGAGELGLGAKQSLSCTASFKCGTVLKVAKCWFKDQDRVEVYHVMSFSSEGASEDVIPLGVFLRKLSLIMP